MPNGILNLAPAAPEVNEFTPTNEAIEETRSDVRRMRILVDRQQDEQEAHQKRTTILSIVLGILLVVLAAAGWLTYPTWKNQKQVLLDMGGLQTVAGTLGERLNSTEGSIGKMGADFLALGHRMDQMQVSMKTNLQTARNQAQAIANQMGKRIQENVDKSLELFEVRMAGFESNQKESIEHVNQLQEQVNRLQRELTTMREQAAAPQQPTSVPDKQAPDTPAPDAQAPNQ